MGTAVAAIAGQLAMLVIQTPAVLHDLQRPLLQPRTGPPVRHNGHTLAVVSVGT